MSASGTDPAGSHVIVLYDGVCGLCNRLVCFVLRRDTRDQFRFASLQSSFARDTLTHHGINSADLNTVYVLADQGGARQRLLEKSAAILEIASCLGGPWKAAGVLRLLPRSLADGLYDLVARHRYQIFGKYETCPLPTVAERGKFLDATPELAPAPIEVVPELTRICGEAHVSEDPAALQACAVDGVIPRAAVEPASVEETAEILKFATAHRLAVVPAGGFTRRHIGAVPRKLDIILRTGRLNTMELEGNQLRAGAGVRLRDLRIRLAEPGLMLPVEAEDESTVGGALAAAGEGPLRGYGSLRECCVAMTFVTGGGVICSVPEAVPDQLRGFDLVTLMIGSYGSLGVIVSASLKVFPRPAQTRTFVAKFLLASGAIQFRDRVLRSALRPMSLELVSPRASEFLDHPEQTWNLYIRLTGDAAEFAGYRSDLGGETYVKEELEGPAEDNLWDKFSAFEQAIVARHPQAMIIHASARVDDATAVIHAAEKIATANNFLCAQFGRPEVASLIIAFVPLGPPVVTQYSDTVSALRAAFAPEASYRVVRCPVEVKPMVELWGLPPSEVEAFRRAKGVMDPSGVLNPGRFVV